MLASRLRYDYDSALTEKAETLASLAELVDNGERVDFDYSDRLMPEFSSAKRREYFEVWTVGGVLLRKSMSLGSGHLPRPSATTESTTHVSDLTLPDGRPGRLVEFAFTPQREDLDSDHDDDGGHPVARLERSISVSRSDRNPTGMHVNAHSHAIGSASPGLFNKRSQPPARAYSGRRAIAHGHGTAQFPDRLVAFDTFQSNRKTPKPVYVLQHFRRTRA